MPVRFLMNLKIKRTLPCLVSLISFLPTEKAISELVTSTCKTVENIKPFKLTSLLALHTRVGKIYSEQFASYNNSRLLSVSGESLNFTITDKAVLSSISTNATILATDLLVKGGVIHVIDKVLVPANFDTKDYCISN